MVWTSYSLNRHSPQTRGQANVCHSRIVNLGIGVLMVLGGIAQFWPVGMYVVYIPSTYRSYTVPLPRLPKATLHCHLAKVMVALYMIILYWEWLIIEHVQEIWRWFISFGIARNQEHLEASSELTRAHSSKLCSGVDKLSSRRLDVEGFLGTLGFEKHHCFWHEKQELIEVALTDQFSQSAIIGCYVIIFGLGTIESTHSHEPIYW